MLTAEEPVSKRSGIFFQRELGKGQNGPGYDFYSPVNDPYYGAIETPLASPVFVPTRVTRAGVSIL